jgi:ribosomal protein S18 acetylase RimI-like enzyme
MFDFKINTSKPQEVRILFEESGSSFIEGIEIQQNVEDYIDKICLRATRFELWNSKDLVGLLAFYRNDSAKEIFITSISISLRFQGLGHGKYLIEKIIAHAYQDQIESIRLEVRDDNKRALEFYRSLNFVTKATQNQTHELEKNL